jgi:hypothetical protein
MYKCPVCPADNIPEDSIHCPKCGTDLSPIRKIRELATIQYNDAVRFADLGATDIAISRLMSVLSLNEKFIEARKLLGKLFWKTKHMREAINQWKQALTFAPNDQEIKDMLQVAGQRMKLRLFRNVFITLIVVLILVLAFYMPAYILFKTSNMQIVRLTNQYQNTILQYSRRYEDLRALEEKKYEIISNQYDDFKRELDSLKTQQGNFVAILAQIEDSFQEKLYGSTNNYEDMIKQLKNMGAQYENEIMTLSEVVKSDTNEMDSIKQEMNKIKQQIAQIDEYNKISFSAISETEIQNRKEMSSINTSLGDVKQELQGLAYRQEQTESNIMKSVGSNTQDINTAIATLRSQHQYLNKALVVLFESLCPGDPEKYTMKIIELENKLGKLHERESKYRARNIFIFDNFNINNIQTMIKQTEADLKLLQEEYNTKILPWQQSNEQIKILFNLPDTYGTFERNDINDE